MTRRFDVGLNGCLAGLAALLSAAAAFGLLHASFCAFTWGKFTLSDYGKYVNMLWNCGHGAPFRMLVDHNYLGTHLSFSLAPLGLLFHVWDHPFLPAALQWLGAMAGAALLGAAARRHGLRRDVALAIVFWAVGHACVQTVLLSEFHGVALLLLLLPWLYYALAFARRWAWLPLVLILGLREDAAFVAVPMLLVFAWQRRWRAGYGWAAFALLYGWLAVTVLYPAIGHQTLVERRPMVSPPVFLAQFQDFDLPARGRAALLALGTGLPLLRRKAWVPLLAFPALAAGIALLSPMHIQHRLLHHYSAGLMACLGPALVAAVATTRDPDGKRAGLDRAWVAAWIVAATLASHAWAGFLPGGPGSRREYLRTHPDGIQALQTAAGLSKEGLLVCSARQAGFVANRRDLLSWDEYDPARHAARYVFLPLRELGNAESPARRLLESGSWGVCARSGAFLALERDADASGNAAILAEVDARRRPAAAP